MSHLIHRQLLEVELQGKGDPFPLQHEVSRVCREALPHILETVFDELVPGPAHYRLERLELDLGSLRVADLERTLVDRVRKAVREALERAPRLAITDASTTTRRQSATPVLSGQAEVEVLSPQASDEELLRSFLETGLVPWWAGRLSGAELEARFVAMMERRGGRAPEWLRGHGGSERMAQRVVGQFSRPVAMKLIEALAREAGVERALTAILEVTPPGLLPTTWRQSLAEVLLPQLLAQPTGMSWPEERIVALAAQAAALLGASERAFREVLSPRIEGILSTRPSDTPGALPMASPSSASHEPGVPQGALPHATSAPAPNSRETVTPRLSAPESPEPALALPKEPIGPRTEPPRAPKTQAREVSSMPARAEARATPEEPPHVAPALAGSEHVPQNLASPPAEPRARPAPTEAGSQEPSLLEPEPHAAQSLEGARLPSPSTQPGKLTSLSETLPPAARGTATSSQDPHAPPEPQWTQGTGTPESPRSPSPQPSLEGAASLLSVPRPQQDAGTFPLPPKPSDVPPDRAPADPQLREPQAPSSVPSQAPSRARESAPAPHASRPHGVPRSSSYALPPLETASERLSTYGLPVDNAGLVLLHPFLKTYFQAVGLLEGKGFRDPAARCRAVCLLQWLAHGDGAEDEHRMALSKVLCGVPLEDVIPRIDGPSESERTEGEELLRHVVAQWTVLKNTSIRGLRESFLQREGLLRRDDMGWVLRMEPRAYDMLLERLPWGLSHIRLSWMSALLRVER